MFLCLFTENQLFAKEEKSVIRETRKGNRRASTRRSGYFALRSAILDRKAQPEKKGKWYKKWEKGVTSASEVRNNRSMEGRKPAAYLRKNGNLQ